MTDFKGINYINKDYNTLKVKYDKLMKQKHIITQSYSMLLYINIPIDIIRTIASYIINDFKSYIFLRNEYEILRNLIHKYKYV